MQEETDLQSLKVSITDLAGREVAAHSGEAVQSVTVLHPDLNHLAPGVYLVKVNAGENMQVLRWVKR
jgi:hypothetical protein